MRRCIRVWFFYRENRRSKNDFVVVVLLLLHGTFVKFHYMHQLVSRLKHFELLLKRFPLLFQHFDASYRLYSPLQFKIEPTYIAKCHLICKLSKFALLRSQFASHLLQFAFQLLQFALQLSNCLKLPFNRPISRSWTKIAILVLLNTKAHKYCCNENFHE